MARRDQLRPIVLGHPAAEVPCQLPPSRRNALGADRLLEPHGLAGGNLLWHAERSPFPDAPHVGLAVDQRAAGVVGRRPVPAVAPADDKMPQLLLDGRRRVQEADALGRAQPLVAVPAVEIAAERLQVQWDHPWPVRAVDGDQRAVGMGELGQGRHRHDQPCARGDVAAQHKAGAVGEASLEGSDDVVGARWRYGDLGPPHRDAPSLARVVEAVVDGAVLLVRYQDLVARLPLEPVDDDVDGHGDVRQESQVLRAGVDEPAEPFASFTHALQQAAAIPGRVQLLLEQRVEHRLVDGAGKDAPRAGVQVDLIGIAQERCAGRIPARLLRSRGRPRNRAGKHCQTSSPSAPWAGGDVH